MLPSESPPAAIALGWALVNEPTLEAAGCRTASRACTWGRQSRQSTLLLLCQEQGAPETRPLLPGAHYPGGTAPEPLNGCLYTLAPFSNIRRPSVYSIALKEHLAIKCYSFFLMVRGPWGPPQATCWAQVTSLPSEAVCRLADCL